MAFGGAAALGDRRRVALLVPAHNESSCIAQTLANLQPQLLEGDRIVVIADNCSDNTAELARQAGAEVVERCDADRRGKGYALDAGVGFLDQNPPQVVIVFDADCQAEAGMVEALSRVVDRSQRPAQALYLMQPPQHLHPEAIVSSFAFLVKNWVRPRALQRLGIPVLLTGSGMAFPWPVIRRAPLASAEIVEDLALGLHLTRAGYGAQFCEAARVWSQLPDNSQAAVSQRTRWEHGYLASMLHEVPRMLMQACKGNVVLLAVALDLMVPPLSLLALLSVLACFIVFNLCLWTGVWYPLGMLIAVGIFAGTGIGSSWYRFARRLIPATALGAIPAYAWRKIDLYRRFLGQRQTQWVRTKRDDESSD